MQKGRFGSQGIFETQRSLQLIFVWQGVAYFLLPVNMIEISEQWKIFFEYIQRYRGAGNSTM